MIEAKAGRVRAEVASAKPLDPAQLSQITAALEKLSGKKVIVASAKTPSCSAASSPRSATSSTTARFATSSRTLRDQLSK